MDENPIRRLGTLAGPSQAFAAALLQLSEYERRLVTCSRLEGRQLRDIAAEMGEPPVVVARALVRAMRRLRRALGPPP